MNQKQTIMKKFKLSQLNLRKENILNKIKRENISDSDVMKLLRKRTTEYTIDELRLITKYIYIEKEEDTALKKYQSTQNKAYDTCSRTIKPMTKSEACKILGISESKILPKITMQVNLLLEIR